MLFRYSNTVRVLIEYAALGGESYAQSASAQDHNEYATRAADDRAQSRDLFVRGRLRAAAAVSFAGRILRSGARRLQAPHGCAERLCRARGGQGTDFRRN